MNFVSIVELFNERRPKFLAQILQSRETQELARLQSGAAAIEHMFAPNKKGCPS
jgi:hypothetical protein